jgi:hypothetical protein
MDVLTEQTTHRKPPANSKKMKTDYRASENSDGQAWHNEHPTDLLSARSSRTQSAVGRFWLALFCCLLIAGCYPVKKVFWAPNGQVAALLAEDALYFCNAKGELNGPLFTNAYVVSWFSNSQDLLLESGLKTKTWTEFTNAANGEWVREISSQAAAYVPRLKAGESSGELLKNIQESKSKTYIAALWLCWRDCHATELANIKEHEELMKEHEAEISVVQRMRYADQQLSKGVELFRSMSPAFEMRLSPDENWFIFTVLDGPLSVASAREPGAPICIETNQVAYYSDWSPDSRSLVFIKADGNAAGQSIRLGVVSSRRILDDQGRLDVTRPNEDLAGLLFDEAGKVRWLKDGRILFSTVQVQLPATAREMAQREQLFVVDPGRYHSVIKLVPQDMESQVPQKWSTFEVSPDSRRISAELDNGGVIIYDLADGKVETVQTDENRKSSEIIPVWKSADELCFTSIATDKSTNQIHRLDLAVWKNGKVQIISESWPANFINTFFNADNAAELLPLKKN